jgi:hypothetical protein
MTRNPQVPLGAGVAAPMGAQTPFAWPVAAFEHARQVPLHAEPQQYPETHSLLRQVVPTLHAWPLAPRQLPNALHAPPGQSVPGASKLVLHAPATQTAASHAGGVGQSSAALTHAVPASCPASRLAAAYSGVTGAGKGLS